MSRARISSNVLACMLARTSLSSIQQRYGDKLYIDATRTSTAQTQPLNSTSKPATDPTTSQPHNPTTPQPHNPQSTTVSMGGKQCEMKRINKHERKVQRSVRLIGNRRQQYGRECEQPDRVASDRIEATTEGAEQSAHNIDCVLGP